MKNSRMICRRIFGLMLACVFLFSGIFGMNGAWTATVFRAAATDGITFTVPETIYLAPSVGSCTQMQYFLNVSPAGSVPQGYGTSGSVYFSAPDATNVHVTCSESGVTLSQSSGTSALSATIGGQVQSLQTGTTRLITWTATFTQNGQTKTVQSYTVLYAPAEDPVGAIAAATAHVGSTDVYASCSTLIYGVQTISSSAMTSMNLASDVHGQTTLDGTGKYKYPLPCHGSTPTMYAGGQAPTTANLMRSIDSTPQTASTSGTAFGYSVNAEEVLVAGGTGRICYDTSRVNKISHIPNFYMHSFLNGADGVFSKAKNFSAGAIYYLSDSAAAQSPSINSRVQYWSNSEKTQSVVTIPSPDLSTVSLGVGYRTLYSAVTRSWTASGTLNGSSTATATATAACEFFGVDKSGVRAAYLQELSQARQCGTNTQAWNTYLNQMRAAATYLGTPKAANYNIAALMSAAQAVADSAAPTAYTLTLNPAGGTFADGTTSVKTVTQQTGSTYTLPTDPVRAGYVLTGWRRANGSMAGETYTFGTADETLTAQWTPSARVVLSVDPHGGKWSDHSTQPRSITGTAGSTVTLTEEPTRFLYHFGGWRLTGSSGSLDDKTYTFGASDNTVEACWMKALYISPAGGTFPDGSTYVKHLYQEVGTTYTLTAADIPHREGFIFGGWQKDSGGALEDGVFYFDSVPQSSGVGIHAIWIQSRIPSVTTYLSLDPNGGRWTDNNSTAIRDIQRELGTVYALPTGLTRSGYTFSGWEVYDPNHEQSFDDRTLGAIYDGSFTFGPLDTVVVAKWTQNAAAPVTTTLTVDPTDGRWPDDHTIGARTIQNTTGQSVTLPADPIRAGYQFCGWRLTSGDGTLNGSTFTYGEADSTVTALWTRTDDLVTLFIAYGTGVDGSSAYKTVTKPVGSTYTLTETPVYSGRTFVCWQTLAAYGSLNGNVYTFGAESGVVGPVWSDDPGARTSLAINANGGVWQNGSMRCKVDAWQAGEVCTLSEIPQRDGYTFSGWQLVGSGSSLTGNKVTIGTTDCAVFAMWSAPATYTLFFNANGGTFQTANGFASGTSQQSKTVTCGQLFGAADSCGRTWPTIARAGYTFRGWYTASGGSLLQPSDTVSVTQNTMAYAQWQPNTYTVQYNGNGATGGSMVHSAHTYDVPQTLTANGYVRTFTVTFDPHFDGAAVTTVTAAASLDGWRMTPNGSGTLYADGGQVVNLTAVNGGTVTLYAQWTDGSVTLPTPARSGYSFLGWYADAACTSSPIGDGGDSFTPAADCTLYAQWSTRSFTLTFNPNGGTFQTANGFASGTSQQSKTVTCGQLFGAADSCGRTWPTIARAGYTFRGWYTASGGSLLQPSDTVSVTQNTTVYAQWQPNTYTVQYNGNGATGGSTASSNHTYGAAKALTANGYTRTFTVTFDPHFDGAAVTTVTAAASLDGWRMTPNGSGTLYADGGQVVNLTAVNGGTVTLYAQWTDGSVTLPTPARTGYSFLGWYADAACTSSPIGDGGDSFTPAADCTLYAQWQPNTYTVQYNGNGATGGSMVHSAHTYDVPQTLTANGYVRTFTVTFDPHFDGAAVTTVTAAASLDGWRMTPNGSGTLYADGGQVVNLTAVNGGTVTLYAQWTDGSVTLPTPARAGYTFTGWYANQSCSTFVGLGGESYTAAADCTLYAGWTPDFHTLTVDPNGGAWPDGSTAVRTSTGIIGDAVVVTDEPERTGYTFAGWLFPDSNTGSFDFTTGTYCFGTTDDTITAKWTATPYAVTVYKNADLWLPYSGTPLAHFAETPNTYQGATGATIPLPTYSSGSGNLAEYVRLDSAGQSIFNGSYTFGTQDETLYSRWIYHNALILNAGGGTFTASAHSSFASQRVMLYDADYHGAVTTVNGTSCAMFRLPGASDLSRSGYIFSGWALQNGTGSLQSNGEYYVFDPNSAGISVAVAQWTRNRFTLVLTGFAGVTDGSGWASYTTYPNRIELTRDAGSTITLPTAADVYNPGNTFLGWYYLNESDGAPGRTTLTLTQDTYLYARWQRNTYTLTLDLNGGYTEMSRAGYTYPYLYRERSNVTDSMQYGYNVHLSSIRGEIYAKEGYAFVGWQPSSGSMIGALRADENISGAPSRYMYSFGIGDETLIAQYEPINYTLTFDTNGGELIDSMAYTVESVDVLPAAVKAGYTFDGWRWIAPGGTFVDPNYDCWLPTATYPAGTDLTGKYGSVTLTAQWTRNVYTLTVDPNGGAWPDGSTAAQTPTGSIGDAVVLNDEPEMTGYTFAGWLLSDGSTGIFDSSTDTFVYGTTDDTLTAQWTANTYSVTYDGNGATDGGTASSAHTYDQTAALTANGFDRAFTVTFDDNYENAGTSTDTAAASFDGWNTAPDGSGTAFADEENVLNLTAADGDTVTLYAQWTDGSVTLPTPTRSGYTFVGWYTDAACTSAVGEGGDSYTPVSDVTLYAKWQENGMLRLKYYGTPGGRPITPGSIVKVTAELCGNPGLISLMVDVHYDTADLELIRVDDCCLFGGSANASIFTPGNDLTVMPYTCLWSDDTAPQNHYESGDLVDYYFRVRTTAQAGLSTIWLSYDAANTVDVNLHPVTLTTQSVDIPICALPGDVNADGIVTMADALLLTWYLNQPGAYTIAPINADLDGDGDTDNDDRLLLLALIAD